MSTTREITEKEISLFTRAKIGLIQRPDSVFITTILFSLQNQWDFGCKTGYTDGKVIGLNPDWFGALDHQEKMGLLAHEAWHVAFNHVTRGENLDSSIFNDAADHVINLLLLSSGFKLPAGGLMDKRFTGMSTMEVYNILLKEQQQSPSPSQSAPPQGGNGNPLQNPDDIRQVDTSAPDAAARLEEISEIIIRANAQKELHEQDTGKQAGSLPGEIEVMIQDLLHPKLPWQTILANYMVEFDKSDYSYKVPNRRFMPDFYLPSLYSEAMGEIALAFDTSGSVSDYELTQYKTEVEAIITQLEPERVTVMSFDDKVQRVDVLQKGQSIRDVELVGRGGTSLFPVFDYYNKHPPMVLLVFSDFYCQPIPADQRPDYPVIWIVVDNDRAKTNFGIQIEYPVGD